MHVLPTKTIILLNRVAAFIHLQPQLSIDLHIPRLQKFINRSPSDPEGCDPALWNAICLVVTSCYGPDADQLESIFLERMRYFRDQMFLHMHGQWLEQYTLTYMLEAWYLLRVGRLFEAQVNSAGTHACKEKSATWSTHKLLFVL